MLRRRTALWIAAVAGVAVTLLLAFDILDPVELPARDFALRALATRPAGSTVVVAIDEESLRTIGPWPWDRATLAAIVNRAAGAGARGVILDILLTDARPGDDQLAAAAHRLPVLAVAVIDEHGEWLMPARPLSQAMVAAHGNFEVDDDGIVRRLSATKQSQDRALTALSVEAASLITGAPVPVGRSLSPAFRTPAASIPTISAAQALRDPALASPMRGKLVFVGLAALAVGDRVLTPTSARHRPDPGVMVHAAATESIVRGDVLHELPPLVAGLLVAVAFGMIMLARRRLIVTAVIVVLTLAGGVLLLAAGIAIPFMTLVAASVFAVAGAEAVGGVEALRRSQARFVDHRERDAESKRVLAHELKTPLASMRGLTQLMGGFELSPEERKRVASLLEHEAEKLEALVETLLDLERLPLRDFASSSSVLDVGDLVAARIDFLRASTNRQLSVSTEAEVLVRGDAALIERAVDNLVGNALKYTAGPVTVHVASNRGEALIDVEDSGTAISDAERERIFQRFVRGETAAGTKGLGLGLSMVAEISRWHGGTVTLESSGQGNRFRVRIPTLANAAHAGVM
jgi:signal transduction histidine kinase